MANYQLGPVIGKIGGVEIITEQVEIGREESREWSLPEGWEEGYIGLRGTSENSAYSPRESSLFGATVMVPSPGGNIQGFGELPGEISTHSSTSLSGTVTLIRTA